jgi:hypothetical protein
MLQMIILGIGKVGATSVRPLDKAAWLEALAALEAEFISFRNGRASPIEVGGIAPATRVTTADTA